MPESISTSVTYFARPGKDNTEETLRLARARAEERGIRTIVVATTKGDTALRASEVFAGFHLVIVTHSTGLKGPDLQNLDPEVRRLIQSKGAVVHTATHAFGGVGRAVRRKLNTYQLEEVIAYTLRIMGQGTKVVCEVALMAADAGLVRTDEEIICISGTGRGADTAMIISPAHAQDFFDLRIKEIICKPRL